MFLFTNIPPPPPPPSKRYIREDVKIPRPKWPEGPEIINEAGDYNMYTVERIVVALVGLGLLAFLILSALGYI